MSLPRRTDLWLSYRPLYRVSLYWSGELVSSHGRLDGLLRGRAALKQTDDGEIHLDTFAS